MAEQKPMTQTQIIAFMAEETGMSKKEVKAFFETFAQLAYKETKKKGKFIIPGIGFLKKVKRKARKGRNPATGETIRIPAKTVAKFTLSKTCKEAIVPPKKK